MSRIPRRLPAELDEQQRRLHEAIAGGPRARNPFGVTDSDGALAGPFGAMLLYPALGDPLQRLGAAIRHHGTLSDRERELAILVIAAALHSGYEQYAHEHIGQQLGLTGAEITAVREHREPELTDAREAAVVRATRRMMDTGTLTDTEYAEAAGALGAGGLFELSTVAGYYRLIALQLRVFGVERPE